MKLPEVPVKKGYLSQFSIENATDTPYIKSDELCQPACSVADDNRNYYRFVAVFLCKCSLGLFDECII